MTPETLDRWRIIPRLLMLAMLVMTYRVVEWFMDLSNPSLESWLGVGHDWGADRSLRIILGGGKSSGRDHSTRLPWDV